MAERRRKPLWSVWIVMGAMLVVGTVFVPQAGIAGTPTPPCPFVPNPPQPRSSGGLQIMSSVVPRIMSPCPGNVLFATYLGGSGEDGRHFNHGVAVDSAGDTYVTGSTTSADFPVTLGAYDTTYGGQGANGLGDVFVARLNSTGALLWATYLGGSGGEVAIGIALDGAGSVYVAGYTNSADFPTTPGTFDRKMEGSSEAFVAKLSGGGSMLLYSTFLGGKQDDSAWGIAVDASGSAYVAGRTSSSSFPVTTGAYDTTYGGSGDVFVTKINPTGSGLVYSTFLGGKEADSTDGIALDGFGNAYVAGGTAADSRGRNTFPTTPGAFDRTFGGGTGGSDGFVTKLNAAGSALVYSTYLGGSAWDMVYGVAVDGSGNAYLTGHTFSADFPTTPGAFDTTFGGVIDAFVTKLNAAGSALVYSTFFGGAGTSNGYAIGVDSGGIAIFAGKTDSGDLPLTSTAYDTTANGLSEAYLARLEPAGDALNYSSYLGGSEADYAYGVAVDAGSNAYLIGYTLSSDFPTTPNAHDLTYNGNGDAFVVKFEP